jgi:Skp family chaperone for outer membrane proteins
MKKSLFLLLSLMTVSISARATKIVTIDTNTIFRDSKAGKALLRKQESAHTKFQKRFESEQKKIAELKQSVSEKMQKGILGEEDIRKELVSVELKERRASFDLEQEKAQLQADLKSEEVKLQKDISATANEIVASGDWTFVVTKDNPFVLASGDEHDGTKELLSAFDKKYETQLAKASLATEKKTA